MTDFDYGKLFDLTGRSGIITGGAGLLGSTFARALLEHGASVMIVDVNEASANALCSELQERYGNRVVAAPCNVAEPAAVDQMVGTAVERFCKIDFLLNNHTRSVGDPADFFAPFEAYKLEEWRANMTINLDGMFLVAQAVSREMVKAGVKGSIVQTSSIYGVLGSDNRIYEGAMFKDYPINNPVAYSASKAGLLGLTRWMATYYAEHGIRVNAVAPGGVFSNENEEFTQKYANRIPMGRMAWEHEIAGTMVWLVSGASSYVTGQCIMVDGGLSAW